LNFAGPTSLAIGLTVAALGPNPLGGVPSTVALSFAFGLKGGA
jgi:hypothetical protein